MIKPLIVLVTVHTYFSRLPKTKIVIKDKSLPKLAKSESTETCNNVAGRNSEARVHRTDDQEQ